MKAHHKNGRPFRRPGRRSWVMLMHPNVYDEWGNVMLEIVSHYESGLLRTGEIGMIDGRITFITSPLKGTK